MALSPRLEMRQSQSLVMTPQLQQAIKLLQLSNLDLSAYVEQQLTENPLLQRGEDGEAEGDRAAPEADVATLGADALVAPDAPMASEADSPLDASYDDVFAEGNDMGSLPASASRGSLPDDGDGLEGTLSAAIGLKEHLLEQLQATKVGLDERFIIAALIEGVDDAGYLNESLEDVAERLGVELEAVEDALWVLHGFDPTGVGARSLAECLRLQCAAANRLDPAMAAMLDNLELVARRDVKRLGEVCGVDAEDIHDMIAELRRLNPKPGLAFEHDLSPPAVPDVLVRRAADGSWVVELNAEVLPRVLIDRRYLARVSAQVGPGGRARADKAYVSDCLSQATWLVKALDQRARTILKVATELVRRQQPFLEQGVRHLRPLNLKAIAEETSLHESTVSRVTANKTMATPRGVFDLKYFFTAAIASADGGEAHSAEAVRDRIKHLIDDEPPGAILSDDAIVALLKDEGVTIARRTVAKYRESLRIPSSVERRRLKAMSA
ncbi:RNA polymerase factor sigma-54 [Zavarzinia sp. CC-PAN008]|uniref:RNA polymerase factor sigma-54 n=1 Tax=Zavarzinia sp. CC-PAN008 TaxID=3243332 RepID=UPI003F7459B8